MENRNGSEKSPEEEEAPDPDEPSAPNEPIAPDEIQESAEEGDSVSEDTTRRSDDRRPSAETLALRHQAVSYVLDAEKEDSAKKENCKTDRSGEMQVDGGIKKVSSGRQEATEEFEKAGAAGVSLTELVDGDLKTVISDEAVGDSKKQSAVIDEEKVEEGAEAPDAHPLIRSQTEILASFPPRLERGGGGGVSSPGAFQVRGPTATSASQLPDDAAPEDSNSNLTGESTSPHVVNAELVDNSVSRQREAPVVSRESSKIIEATPMEDMSAMHSVRQLLKHRSVRIVLAIVAIVLIGAIVGLVVGLSGGGGGDEEEESSDPGPERTMPPGGGGGGERPGDELDGPLGTLLLSKLNQQSRQSLISNQGSSQRKAFRWLRDSPDLKSYSEGRRLQRYALATFYFETRGDADVWVSSDGWISDTDECEWYTTADGEACSNGTYTNLELVSNRLEGRLENADLYLLSSLQVIDITSNAVTGFIPSWIGDLSQLQNLIVWKNLMSGLIPMSLLRLESLKFLDLQANFFVGGVPSQLGSLSSLLDLYFGETNLEGQLPSELGLLTNLEVFDVLASDVSGTIPVEFSNLSSLIVLNLDETVVKGELPTELGLLQNLETLYIDAAGLVSTIPSEWGNMISLRDLTMERNQLYGTIPTELALCRSLEDIALATNNLTGTVPTEFGSMDDLTFLYMGLNSLNGTLPTELGNLAFLRFMWLYNNPLQGTVPTEFGRLTSLEEFDIEDTNLGGNMPDEVCALTVTDLLEEILVDCDSVQCECCTGCTGTNSSSTEFDSVEALLRARLKPESLQALLDDPDSPQAKAFRWLEMSAMLDTYSSSRRLQRYALATLYYATRGDEVWISSDGWLSDTNECEWFNVPLDTAVCVNDELLSLDLSGNGLDGSLETTDLYLLSALQVFDVTGNRVLGAIPSWIGDLVGLRTLSLWNNSMSGAIPPSVSNLTKLQSFVLEGNLFTGAVPTQIGDMSALVEIYLGESDISGQLPSEIGLLGNLEILSGFKTGLSGTLPIEFSTLSSLSQLDLDFTLVNGQLPSEYGLLTNLEILFLDNARISSTIPAQWGNLRLLLELTLEGNSLFGTVPSEFGLLTQLEGLWLANNTLTGSLATELGNLGNLLALDLSINSIDGTLPTELGQLVNLELLWMIDNDLRGTIPTEFGQLLNLISLDLEDNLLGGVMPDEVCELVETHLLEEVLVDCDRFACACCSDCEPTD